MAETNGSGRLDRIEAALDRREAAQVRHRQNSCRDHKQLMIWHLLMQDKMEKFSEERDRERKRLDQLWENTDIRIADLVAAIGQFIQR
jgi:hypothetical protein